MRGGGVHETSARVVGDVIAGEEWNVVIPLAVAAFDAAEGMGEGQALKCFCRN